MIGAYRVKPTTWEATGIGAIMNRSNQCPACSGGGLVPAPGCTCNGNVHTCIPVICPACNGTGIEKHGQADEHKTRRPQTRGLAHSVR